MKRINDYFEEVSEIYYLDEDGNVINTKTQKRLNSKRYRLLNKDGQYKNYTLKNLYSKIFNKNAIDNIENLENEEWRAIDGTDNNYWVSNFGRIKSYKWTEAELIRIYDNEKGYKKVDIYINNKKVNKFLHRLVIETFIGKAPKEDMQVHHLDCNKSNNSLTNLVWIEANEHYKIHNTKENQNGNSTKSKNYN